MIDRKRCEHCWAFRFCLVRRRLFASKDFVFASEYTPGLMLKSFGNDKFLYAIMTLMSLILIFLHCAVTPCLVEISVCDERSRFVTVARHLRSLVRV